MSHRSWPLRRRRISAAIVVIGTFAGLHSMSTVSATPVGTVIDYEQTASAVIPASSFGGATGGDGWALAFTDSNIYNVFHHDFLRIACRSKTTGVACSGNGYSNAGTKLVSDGSNELLVAMGPPVHIDKIANRLYTMAVRETSGTLSGTGGTTGVVEIDLASTSTNPFVAFYPLSRDGEGGCNLSNCRNSWSSTHSNVAKIGTKWYVYNYVSGVGNTALPDSRNKLLCFDFATKSACGGQPYDVTRNDVMQGRLWEPPTIAAVGNRIFVNIYGTTNTNSLAQISCVDVSSTPTNCTGWPIDPNVKFSDTFTAVPAFPLVNSSGTAIGVCFPGTTANACANFAGQAITDTAVVTSALAGLASPFDLGWATTRGEAYVDGTRMFVPNVVDVHGTSQVECYDFAINNLCADFPNAGVSQPKTFDRSELEAVYTAQLDPADPSCLWLMGHAGTKQIQNFDLQTGGACGANGFVLPISNFRESQTQCAATAWKQFTLVSPTAGNFTSGTVEFVDARGAAIPGLVAQNFGSNGTLDLASLNLQTYPSLARLHVRLQGSAATAINVKMRWASEYHPECVASGQTAFTTNDPAVVPPAQGIPTTTISPATTVSPVTVAELPETGVDISTTVVWAMFLSVVGALMIATRRRGHTT